MGGTTMPSSDWAWARCSADNPFPGTPDPTQICLKGGFDPALLYQVVFTARDPYVLGIGFAAFRDMASFFRNAASDDEGTPNPLAGQVSWIITRGNSQSGNFLRALLHLGFTQDEAGRKVYDGAWPIIALIATITPRWRLGAAQRWLLCLLGWLGVSTALAYNPHSSVGYLASIGTYMVLGFALVAWLDNAERALRREATILAALRPHVSMRVPDLRLHAGTPLFSEHAIIPGEHLETAEYEALPAAAQQALGDDLARFYADLHALDRTRMAAAGAQPVERWLPAERIADVCSPMTKAAPITAATTCAATRVRLGPSVRKRNSTRAMATAAAASPIAKAVM